MAPDEDERIRYKLRCVGDASHREVNVSCLLNCSMLMDARCCCKLLESEFIPCAHIFTILRSIEAEFIPQCIIKVRWTMRAKNAFFPEKLVSTHVWSE